MDDSAKAKLAAARAKFIRDRWHRRENGLPMLETPEHLLRPTQATGATTGSTGAATAPTEEPVPSTSGTAPTEEPVPSTSGTAGTAGILRESGNKRRSEVVSGPKSKVARVEIGGSLYNTTMDELEKASAPPPPKIFTDKTLVLDTPTCKMFIQKKDFKRQKKFSSTNRLFRISVTTKPQTTPPLMLDSLDLLREALDHILTDIQSSYDDSKYRQIYLTLTDRQNLTHSGLNTANFSLHTPKMQIIEECVKQFFLFLQSHRDMTLTNSFNIDVKILGLEHVRHRLKVKRNLKLHLPPRESAAESTENEAPDEAGEESLVEERGEEVPATENEPDTVGTGHATGAAGRFSGRWFFSPPKDVPAHKFLFANKCLLVAVIFGVFRIRASISEYNDDRTSEDYQMWQIMYGLYSREDEDRNTAGRLIYKEMEKVCSSEGIDISQTSYTVPDTLPKLASYYNCQFIVYSDRVDGNITFQTHNPIRDSLPIVLLYQQSDSHTAEYDSDGNTLPETDHICLITNQYTFQTEEHFQCYQCFKVYRGKRPHHRCHVKVQYSSSFFTENFSESALEKIS